MMPDDRLVCAFVQPLEQGDKFKDWPLHVTVVPWFRTDASSPDLAEDLQTTLRDIKPFEVVMGGEARFGRNKLVNLVRQPTPFTEIERHTRDLLNNHTSWIVDETTKAKRSFRPHVTEQKDGRLNRGETFVCDTLFIIEQKGGHKTVAGIIDLG